MSSANSEEVTLLLASCPLCSNIKPLEACIDCFKAMCADCMKQHVEKWKISAKKFCNNIDVKIKNYLTKIASLTPLMDKNLSRISLVKAEIDTTHQKLVEKLNSEKMEIFKQLDEIEKENNQFRDFEQAILKLQKDIHDFNKTIATTDKYTLGFSKFNECKTQVTAIGKDFNGIRNKPFKVLGDYDKPTLSDTNFFGSVIINDAEPLKSPQKTSNKANPPQADQTKIHMFGTLRVQLKKVAEQMSEFQQLFKSPVVELDTPTMPNFISNYCETLFIADEEGNFTVAESKDELTIKFTCKLSFINIRAVAANQNLVGLLYSDLSKDNLKAISKKLKYKKLENKSGIALYRWTDEPFRFEKAVDLYKQPDLNGGLKTPNGLCMNESVLFVCDRELQAVFKIDIKTGDVMQKFLFTESEPIGLGLCTKFLVVVDSRNQEISTFDLDNLKVIKSVKIGEDFQSLSGGLYDVVIHQKNYLFVKSRSDTRVMIYDSSLQFKNCFEYDGANYQGIGILGKEKMNETIVIGKNLDNKNFKIGYFNDFQ